MQYYVHVFFNDTATTEIYTLSLHDALPICTAGPDHGKAWAHEHALGDLGDLAVVLDEQDAAVVGRRCDGSAGRCRGCGADRKSTRLNSSHANISYAVFCLKKKQTTLTRTQA